MEVRSGIIAQSSSDRRSIDWTLILDKENGLVYAGGVKGAPMVWFSTITRARATKSLGLLVVVLCVPVFLCATSVRWVVNEPRIYSYGFSKYDIARVTGISYGQLEIVASQIRDYFDSADINLDARIEYLGVERAVFNQREILHMRDVKSLIQSLGHVQKIVGAFLLLTCMLALSVARWSGVAWIAKGTFWGCALTIGLVVATGIVASVAWNQLFLAFHLVSFTNALWQLDPQTDYLIMMFPSGFFFDATVLVALAVSGEAIALGYVAWGARRFAQRRKGTSMLPV